MAMGGPGMGLQTILVAGIVMLLDAVFITADGNGSADQISS